MAMERNRNSTNTRILKEKSDETDISFAIPEIQLRARGNEKHKCRWINFIIEHRQIAPFGGHENFRWIGFDYIHRRRMLSILIRHSAIENQNSSHASLRIRTVRRRL